LRDRTLLEAARDGIGTTIERLEEAVGQRALIETREILLGARRCSARAAARFCSS